MKRETRTIQTLAYRIGCMQEIMCKENSDKNESQCDISIHSVNPFLFLDITYELASIVIFQ